MIESVSTLPVQSNALRSSPQSDNAAPPSNIASPSNFISSRVRVDNLQNVAILEYRSSEGDVVRQYPTEAQIQAFKSAARLAENRAETARSESAEPAPAPQSDVSGASASYAPPSPNANSGGTSFEA